jgi:hypothetical protein
MRNVVRHFHHGKPVVVVNEGLFQYLNAAEMEIVAKNVRDILAEFGGAWISPDFSLREEVMNVSELQRRFRQIVAAVTDRQMYNNAFENDAQLKRFLTGFGLQYRVLNQLDVSPKLVSMDALQLAPEMIDQAKPRLKLWVLTLDAQCGVAQLRTASEWSLWNAPGLQSSYLGGRIRSIEQRSRFLVAAK